MAVSNNKSYMEFTPKNKNEFKDVYDQLASNELTDSRKQTRQKIKKAFEWILTDKK